MKSYRQTCGKASATTSWRRATVSEPTLQRAWCSPVLPLSHCVVGATPVFGRVWGLVAEVGQHRGLSRLEN